MATTALMEPDVLIPEDDDLDRQHEAEVAYSARLANPDLTIEPDEPYLAAREAWVLARLNREMVLAQGPNPTGLVTPETDFVLGENQRKRRPDLAFISAERWPIDEPAPDEANWRLVPDLAVEIVSPNDLKADLIAKIEQYFAAGVRLVWTVHPAFRKVYVYRSPKAVAILDQDDTLDGGDVVAGFAMPLRVIFPAPRQAATPPQP